ncbi:MAG: oligoendopeptidase F family protein [Clostridia bacterium]|nr:oligoendopeptidase F family protein [Clostridia bacterium]
MDRDKINDKFKWKVSDIYESRLEFDADCERIRLMLRKLANFRGKLNNTKSIEKFMTLNTEMERKLEKVMIYAQINKSIQNNSPENSEMGELASNIMIKAGEDLSFADSEIACLPDEMLVELSKTKELADYRRYFEFMIKNKAHVLSPELEKIVSGAGAYANFEDLFNVLSNAEMPMKDILTPTGKKLRLTNSNYSKFVESPTRIIRKQAYENYNGAYGKFNMTYATNYINCLKYQNFLVKSYNFKSNFERISFYDEVPDDVLPTMLDCVHKNVKIFSRFEKLKKKALGVDTMKIYDLFAPSMTNEVIKYPFNRGAKIILDSLSVLGEEYTSLLVGALKNRWVDLYPSKNKESLCYCTSCYDVHPFVLTNYNNTLESISTLSHELGHAMQAYIASKTQPFVLADSSSLTGEIASTVNEILTKKFLIDSAKTKTEKMQAIESLLVDFYAAIYKQALYTEFELYVSSEIEKNELLTFEKLNKKYKSLLKEYFGDIADNTAFCEFEWSRLPHLYSPFYVYTYVVGFVSACYICGKLLSGDKNYKNKYFEFLKSGSSKNPIEQLAIAEIDITNPSFYNQAFKLFELYLDEFEELIVEGK